MKPGKISTSHLILFLVSALVIMLFFPRELRFKYQFHIGKPWRYGLLTAPTDLSIYKTDAQINIERDSILKNFKPYYSFDENVAQREIELFKSDQSENKLHSSDKYVYINYIEKKLAEVYSKGVLNPIDYNNLINTPGSLMVFYEKNVATERPVGDFYSTTQAYRYIVDEAPAYLSHEQLSEFNIDRYIEENIIYDPVNSERIKEEAIRNIHVAIGKVQAGERIIDRGVIVDQHAYEVLSSLKTVYETSSGSKEKQLSLLAGQLVLILALLACFFVYIRYYHPPISWRNSRRYIPFMISALTFCCLLTEFAVNFSLFNIYIIPFAILPITICIFFDSRSAIFINLITILICSLIAPFSWEFILIEFTAGMVAVFTIKDLTKRSQLIKTAFFVFITYCVVYTAIVLYQEGDISKVSWLVFIYFFINLIFLLFVYVLIYILEKIFGIISNVTLVELSDINTPLLQLLSESCPGTFQHSLQVSFLAAEATRRIGGNVQLARTGALYHDIGKLTNPEFFTENQSVMNPHDKLDPAESAKIIIEHVEEGVKIARKNKLPEAVIDFIRTHHGTGKTKYFLNTLKNENPGMAVDETLFSYKGPNPDAKETAVVMLADSVEAASRSLKEYTEESLHDLVDKIVNAVVGDGLLQGAPITFQDIATIKEVFYDKLKTMYHTRISYPEPKQP